MAAQGSVVLVAGGTGGLGRAVSRAFLEAGATVSSAIARRRNSPTCARRRRWTRPGCRATSRFTDEAAVRQMVERIAAQHGRLDALVNAVGGYAGGAPLWNVEAAVLDRMLALNLRPNHVLARAVVPLMLKQGSGSIVAIAAKAALEHTAGAAAYAASKAAALALMDRSPRIWPAAACASTRCCRASSTPSPIGRQCRRPTSRAGRGPRTSRASFCSCAATTPR